MSLVFSLNNVGTNDFDIMPTFVNFLISSGGWSLKASGNGLAGGGLFDLTGVTNYFTNSNIAASTNPGTWAVIQMPGTSGRQYCLAKRNDGSGFPGSSFRVKYSFSAGFTQPGKNNSGVANQTISATQNPSATDEQIILGVGSLAQGGTADDTAASTGGKRIFPDPGLTVYHMACQTTAPYGFWCVGHYNAATAGGSGALSTQRTEWVILLDPLQNYDAYDNDPYVHFWTDIGGNESAIILSASEGLSGTAGNINTAVGYVRKGLSNEGWVKHAGLGLYAFNSLSQVLVAPRNIGSNLYNGGEESIPIPWTTLRVAGSGVVGASGMRGYSSLMRWKATNWNITTLLKKVSDNDAIVIDDVLLDWDGATPVRY